MATSAKKKGKTEMQPEVAALISLIVPVLGLYFIWPEAKKMTAIIATAVVIIVDILLIFGGGLGGLVCFVPFFLWLFVPVIHVAGAVYTLMEAKK